jgi:hypothetical protein
VSDLIIRDQREITTCALEIIEAIHKKRGRPLQTRDRMALKLLTPQNAALILKNGQRHLGCHQVSFDIVTDDIGKGSHRLIPVGVHVFNPKKGWWTDQYGAGQFLWNLYLKEDPQEGVRRILERLFKFKMAGVFGPKAKILVNESRQRTIAGDIEQALKLYIQREHGAVETTLRRMVKADAIYLPSDLGITPPANGRGRGHVCLLFGKNKRYAVSFVVQRL